MKMFAQVNSLFYKSSFFYAISIDMSGCYLYVSPNYDRNFDFIGSSLLGKAFSITLHPDDVAICEQVGKQCFLQPDELVAVTLRKHDGKGGFLITQWEIQAMFDANGQPEGIYCVGYNITKYMQVDSELRQARTEIEVSRDRMNEIGLLQSHGVRRPLANIMGLTGILSSMDVEPNHRQIHNLLDQSSKELDQLIHDISTIASL